MAGATLSTLTNVLKDYYLPPVVEQLNNEVLLLNRLEARDQELYGKQAVVPLHTARTGAIGARAEGGTLPTAGNQSWQKATYDLKYLYGTIQVTGPSMAKTSSDAGAFVRALQSEIDGMQNDLKKDTARQIYGDGSARIGINGTNVTVTSSSFSTNTTVTLSSDEPLRKGQIYINQVVDIGTQANPVVGTAAGVVTDISIANKTFTFTGAATGTIANGHFVFRQGSAAASSVSYEMDGLCKAIPFAANTFGGIDSTAAGNSYWDVQRIASGGSVTISNMQQAWNTNRVAGGDVGFIITSFGGQRQYYQLLQSQVRYNEPTALKGGFTSLDFMGKELIADLEAPYGNVYFIDDKFLKVFTNQDWHWLDEDGHILKWVTGVDGWQAALARYINLGATRRNTQVVLTGITDATGL